MPSTELVPALIAVTFGIVLLVAIYQFVKIKNKKPGMNETTLDEPRPQRDRYDNKR